MACAAIHPRILAKTHFFQHAAEMDRAGLSNVFGERAIDEAGEVLEMISRSDEERLRYELRVKAHRDEISNLEGARAEGRVEGREEGREEERVEGRDEGRVKGRVEGREKGVYLGKLKSMNSYSAFLQRRSTR